LMSTGIASPDMNFDAAPNRQNVASHTRPLATVLVVAAAEDVEVAREVRRVLAG